ncbi:MAG: ATP-binding cassette domain-containing protein [Saprospiraceae bacterium]|nr:ATP-binding cassette domain-containing protein [Saprospiraceae bacterium]
MSGIPLVLEIKNSVFGQDNIPILSQVDFSLAKAEMCYLIGKSGSGKTTFLKTLYGSIPLLSGKAKIASFELDTLNRKSIPELRRAIGMVFQKFHLFERWTIYQNLEYVLKATEWKDPQQRADRILQVLEEIKLMHKKDVKVHQLSGGEQQKVVIARAILNNPTLIIADEPTGNLDPVSSEEIMNLLYTIAKKNKMAILIATHDHLLIQKFPARVFECADGKITEV